MNECVDQILHKLALKMISYFVLTGDQIMIAIQRKDARLYFYHAKKDIKRSLKCCIRQEQIWRYCIEPYCHVM